jgi:hypothetical protein
MVSSITYRIIMRICSTTNFKKATVVSTHIQAPGWIAAIKESHRLTDLLLREINNNHINLAKMLGQPVKSFIIRVQDIVEVAA